MSIRRVTQYDEEVYQAMLRLLPQLTDTADEPSKEHFEEILKSENSQFFVAENRVKEIVGMLTLGIYLIPTGKRFWIEDVVVDSGQRGKGIGEELMTHAIYYAKGLGAKSIHLTSRPQRVAANRLYLKMGFTQRETNAFEYKI